MIINRPTGHKIEKMAKQQWHQFSPEFTEKLHAACRGVYRIDSLQYEVIVKKIWVAQFNISGLTKTGEVGLTIETRLGKESSLAVLEDRLIRFVAPK